MCGPTISISVSIEVLTPFTIQDENRKTTKKGLKTGETVWRCLTAADASQQSKCQRLWLQWPRITAVHNRVGMEEQLVSLYQPVDGYTWNMSIDNAMYEPTNLLKCLLVERRMGDSVLRMNEGRLSQAAAPQYLRLWVISFAPRLESLHQD